MEQPALKGPFLIEVSEEEDAKIQAMIEQAEADIATKRVSFRWGEEQIAIIKRAAALYGVPYQTYLKEAALRQAIADIKDLQSVASGSSTR